MALLTELDYPLVQYPLPNSASGQELTQYDLFLAISELQRAVVLIQKQLVAFDSRITALEP